jgi:hypothetical protein
MWKYCGKCHQWNQTHTTSEHRSKTDLLSQVAQNANGQGVSANLASSTQSGSLVDTAVVQSSNVQSSTTEPTKTSSNAGSYLHLDF